MAVIEIDALRKEYRRARRPCTIAVAGLDLSVPEGGVYGFLGPNGAGKTTTIRCLLGLVAPGSGRTRLLGAEPANLHSVISRVGSIVETPAMFPTMSARTNLELLGRIQGIGPKTVGATLERVGLAARAGDPVRTFSLGMKQRLGIAGALLKDPEVLILDEPANGLDPAGIKEVRELLRALGAEGRTVFVSSHILGEVQQMCDRVAIIARGRLVTAGSVDEVLASRRGGAALVVRLDDLAAGTEVLRAAGFDATLEGNAIRIALGAGEAARVTQALAAKELYLSELRPEEVNLEDVFLDLTRDQEPPP